MPKTTAPSDALAKLDHKLAGLQAELNGLETERRAPAQRLDAARARALDLDAQGQAGVKVDAALKAAVTERLEAKAAYEESELVDWDARRQALVKAIGMVEHQRAQVIAAQAVPLIQELEPKATEVNEQIMECAEQLQRLFMEHGQVRARAEQVLRHLDHYDGRTDIPASSDQFQPIARALDRLVGEGVGWPLPDLTKPPRKLAYLGPEDQEAWQSPAERAAA
ncbi:MAG TPA: hypothetical protein VEX39_11630 [Thermoleophilaceae bacterium]|nr:hypothetical protein [Thermoleophilaceae bacterium]